LFEVLRQGGRCFLLNGPPPQKVPILEALAESPRIAMGTKAVNK